MGICNELLMVHWTCSRFTPCIFLFFVIYVAQIVCECDPRLYIVNSGSPITTDYVPTVAIPKYCSDINYGGGHQTRTQDNNSTCGIWSKGDTWTLIVGGCVNANTMQCPCTCHNCKGASAMQVCAASYDYYEAYCYHTTNLCSGCTEGNYRIGCGCVYYNGTFGYNSNLYTFTLTGNYIVNPTLYRGDYRHICGSGSCQICPRGHICPGSAYAVLPVKCAPGTFKTQTGIGVCRSCECLPNTFLVGSYDKVTHCDVAYGLKDFQCVKCDECTEPDLYSSLNNNYKEAGSPVALCPSRNYGRGYDHEDKCVPCTFCVNPKEYALPEVKENYCLTSKSDASAQCKQRYYNATDAPDADSIQDRELQIVGTMPWKPRYKRNHPSKRNFPGPPTKGGRQGLLPYYTKCDKSESLYGGAYEPTTNDTIIKILTEKMDWQFDCMREFTAQCSHNHYAIISDGYGYIEIPSLIRCLHCPNNTVAPADHRATKCDCIRGSASQISFRDKYGELDVMLPYGTAIDGRLCVDCFNYVFWRHSVNAELWQEALTCTRDEGDGIKHCSGLTFVNKANQSCQKCQKEYLTIDSNNNVVVYIPPEISESSFSLPDAVADLDNNNSNISNTTTSNISLYNLTVDSMANSTTAYLNISHVSNNTQVYATSAAASSIPESKQKIPHLSRTGCYYCPSGTHYKAVGNIEDGDGFYECEKCDPSQGQYQDFAGQANCKIKIKKCSPGNKLIMNDFADRDHKCVPCDTKCGDNQITVMSPNKTFEQDTCDGEGGRFFGCYDGSLSGAGPSFQPGTRLVYEDNAMRANVESCDSALLPDNSEWVGYRNSNAPGVECYFACSHGVNLAVAINFTSHIDTYVRRKRVDLKPFNNIIMPGASSEPIGISFDNLWRRQSNVPSKGWSEPSSLSQYKRNDAMSSNTFLFIEDAIIDFKAAFGNLNLCISAATAYTLQCPIGFARSSSFTPQDYNCARDARNNLYCSSSSPGEDTTCSVASCSGNTCRQVCESESGGILSSFRVGCTVNCIDLMFNNAVYVDLPLFSRWGPVFDVLTKYLRQSTWNAKSVNPYNFVESETSNCSSFTCKSGTFLYSIDDHADEELEPGGYIRGHSACIPCDAVGQVCGLFNPVRFPIDNPDCMRNGGATTADVCTLCSRHMDNANLISNSYDYARWLDMRKNKGTSGNGKPIWDIPCRYYCAEGYTSNNESPDAYKKTPCISCSNIPKSLSCTQNTTIPTYYDDIGTCGSSVNNIDLFTHQCKNCADADNAGIFSYSVGTENPSRDAGECLAMCDASKYHSLNISTTNGSEISTLVNYHIPRKHLRCELCTSNQNIPCNGKCDEGYYQDNSTSPFSCVKCNKSACGNADYFRETCISGSTRDAQCVPCPSSYLKNDPYYYQQNSSNYNLSLLDAINNEKELIVRKWVSNVNIQNNESLISVIRTPFSQCFATCVNNYVWIDIQTGLFPRQDDSLQLSRLYCIRCDGTYIKNGLAASSSALSLYSFWNSTNESIKIPDTLVGSALNNMVSRRVKGGCYSCDGINKRNVIETSTEMCELKAGVTDAVQGSFGTAIVEVGDVSITAPKFNDNIAVFDWGRRRLLSVQTTGGGQRPFTVKRIKIRTQPILRGRIYACCELLTIPSKKIDCMREMGEMLESKKLKYSEDWGSDYCETIMVNNNVGTGRRLLMQQDVVSSIETSYGDIQIDEDGTCFTGTYKDKRGNGDCFSCPSGASTTYPFTGATNRTQCQCLPGFSSVRVNNSLSYCTACGWNFYRTNSMNDSTCIACPRNMYTPTRASSYCYCNAGFYRNFSDDECVKCEPGFYCPQNGNNARIQCPVNSMSYVGAYHRGNCTCNSPAYYGYLLNPMFECLPRPPGLNCKVDYESNIGSLGNLSCNCAPGWNRIEIENSDNGNSKDHIIFRCVSTCQMGQYAVLESDGMSISKCVQCPINTYSSMSQAIQIKNKPHENQCTPCPPNTDTRGKEGIYNMSECLCSGAIILLYSGGDYINNNTTNNSDNNILPSGSNCGTCEAGTYLDLSVHACKKCPEGTTSSSGDVMGISACLCEPGHKATKKLINLINGNSTINTDVTIFCEPCPIGYFSNKLGASCTACGKYTTTLSIGSKSIRDCVLIQ